LGMKMKLTIAGELMIKDNANAKTYH